MILVAIGLGALSATVLAVLADWGPGAPRVFLRSMRWGIGTGAATGALVGFTVVLVSGSGDAIGAVGVALFVAPIGAIVGSAVAIVPSVVGGLVLTGVIRRRHPQPASEEAVRRDLERMFQAVAVVLNAGLLAALATGDGVSALISALPSLAAGNACVALMLCRARAPIGRAWSEVGL